MDKEEGKIFFELFSQKREEENVSLGEVCDGLCTPREIAYMERGERFPERLLQDRLLARLGVNADDYEYFLGYPEYERWKKRQRILHYIIHDDMEEAKGLLKQYEGECAGEGALDEQFCLEMRFQIRRREKAEKQELYSLCLKAARLTIPDAGEECAFGKTLSVQELNLLLELERYRPEGQEPGRYLSLMESFEKRGFDEESRVALYPKMVYFLCSCRPEGAVPGDGEAVRELRYCNHAIGLLRSKGRLYYFWEILKIREGLLGGLKGRMPGLATMLEETTGWRAALERVCGDYGVPRETFHDCHLHMVKYVDCVNDIIRIRRGMLGISPRELCDGVCDVKTLRRLENRQTVPQRAVVVSLLGRLGLSGEHRHTEVVTESPEVNRMVRELRDSGHARQFERSDRLLEKIKGKLDLGILLNRQMLMAEEAMADRGHGRLTGREYYERLKAALELTVPYEACLGEGERYLTLEEQVCLHNMLMAVDRGSEEFRRGIESLERLYRSCWEEGTFEAVFGMYFFILEFVGSEYGNLGELDRADGHSAFMAQESLWMKWISYLPSMIYDRWWNYNERRRRNLPVERELDTVAELQTCITLCQIIKNIHDLEFYQNKLKKVLETDI